MKILRLRTDKPVTQFQSADRFVDGEHNTRLGVMPWGSFVISREGKSVLIPATAAIADVAFPEVPDVAAAENTKRGFGRAKKEPDTTA